MIRVLVLILLLALPAVAQNENNWGDFDRDVYEFTCSTPPDYDHFGIYFYMYGDWFFNEAWLRLEYRAGLHVDPEQWLVGNGWSSPENVEVWTWRTAAAWMDSAVMIHMFCSPEWQFYPPGELCYLKDVWSDNTDCYDDTLFLVTYWRDGGSAIHSSPFGGARAVGVIDTDISGSTWGTIKALFRESR